MRKGGEAMTKPDNLANEMEKILDQYAGVLPEIIAEAQKAAGKRAVKDLKSDSPRKSGEYAKGWKTKTETSRTGASTTIYNGDKPELTHLLEFGHASISGGRTLGQVKAYPHIADAEKKAAAYFESELQRRLENGT